MHNARIHRVIKREENFMQQKLPITHVSPSLSDQETRKPTVCVKSDKCAFKLSRHSFTKQVRKRRTVS